MSKKKNTKAVQSRAVDINQLPKAQSRSEQYLDFLCGRAVDINALPKPQSRIEEFLEYLCHNIGNIGGGGGQPFNGVTDIQYDAQAKQLQVTNSNGLVTNIDLSSLSGITDIEFDEATRTLKKIIEGQEEDVVSGLVTQWGDLEDVNEYPYANLLEYNKKVTGFAYTGNGDVWRADSRWSTAFIDVEEGKIYTVFRKHQDSNRFIYTNSVGGTKINAASVNSNWDSNGFNGRAFTIPVGQGITKLAIMFQHGLNAIDEIMVFEGEIREIPGFIPFADKALIQIGTKVSHKFDNEGSNLKSTTVHSAIKELDVEINNKVSQDEVTVLSDANKVVRLDGNGKLDLSVIPNFSINKVHPVLDEQKALELIDNNTAQVGDIFILTNRNNSVYMYVNENGIDFDNKCVELTMADGTVKSVNGVFADDTGNVTIGIDDIVTLRDELNSRLKTINGQAGVGGNVDLSYENTDEKIDFKVENEIFATITYITDNQVQEIKDLFTF